ncbi:alpha/beta fold hydrolase [Sandaracinus amylolyticus]|uniref:Putative hydrolase n=1 Tax=Sandaracinus amylolyticus TaxID=927083 RepID=A0A0F6YFI9_9BACT|nr:alpha/beta hydrolase [Sandaracinus amylolyticus]AKF03741.1 putative hydrolase [Sandaracinus amylolyticus]
MASLTPFRQGRFDALPDVPRVAHGFFERETLDVDVAWGPRRRARVHVRKHGSGPPLLLLHGLMTSSYSWRYVLGPLGERFTCYAPDLPGNGKSEPCLDASYSPASFVTWIAALQDALGIGAAPCIANSMAGYLAMHAALEGVRFERLIQVHGPGIPEARFAALGVALSLPFAHDVLGAVIARDPERWCHRNVHYYDETLKSLEEAREYAAPLRTREGRRALSKYLQETMAIGPMRALRDRLQARRDRAEAFPVPLMLLYARRDPMVPARIGTEYAKLVPGARFEWVEDASHFAHVDAPERFLPPVLSFLNDRSRRAA